MNERIAAFLVKYRLWLFLASLALIGVAGSGLSRIVYIADYKIFFAPDDPHLRAFEDLQDTFTRVDNVVFMLEPKNGQVLSKPALDAVLWLTEASWKLPFSMRVDSLSNYQHTRADGDELLVEDLVPEDFDGSPASIEQIRQTIANEPLVQNRTISKDGALTAMVVSLQLPEDQTVALPQLMEGPGGVNELAALFRATHPDVNLYVTGVSVSNYTLGTVATRDMGVLMPILLAVVLALVGIMTRSVANTFVTLSVVLVSIITTMGTVGLSGFPLNNVSAIAPMVILTLAVAECVHLLCYYSVRLREGYSKVDAMQMSLASNLRAIFFTSFTTAVGFLGMNTIDSPPFVQFGYISSLGIMVAYLFGHTMLPQLAIWLARERNEPEPAGSFHSTAADWVIANPKKVFYGTLLASFGLSAGMVLNDMNDDNVGYFDKEMEVRQAVELAEQHGMGMNFIEYSLQTGEDYGITDLAYLQKVEAFVQWCNQQPEIENVSSFTDVLKRLNQNLHNDDPAYYKLPESRELASQYLLMYEMSLPVGMDLNNRLDPGKSALRITISTRMMKAKESLALEKKVQDWMSANMPELQTHGASPTIMFAHIGQNSIRSVMAGSLSAIAIICLCMMFAFGSWKLGLMALLPNIFPSTIALGVWGLLVGEVNMGVAVIFTISAGIIVDDTIHLFSKFADGLRKGLSVDDSIRYSFEHAGRGVVITTVVLCAGFAILGFSDFVVNRTLGILVAGTIAIAILFDLLFLPSVLKMFPINLAEFRKQGAADKAVPAATPSAAPAPVKQPAAAAPIR